MISEEILQIDKQIITPEISKSIAEKN